MKFLKLKLHNVPDVDPDKTQWSLILETVDDINRYISLDAHLNAEAMLTLERDENGDIKTNHVSPQSTRAIALTRLLSAAIDSLPEGNKLYPLLEVANITDKKHLGMLKTLRLLGPLRVNPAGGYCSLNSFVSTWKAEIVEEITKNDFGFPVDDDAIEADTIVLENSHQEYATPAEHHAKKHILNPGKIAVIYNLREVDQAYVFKSLLSCSNVSITSQLMDDAQLDSFMGLFAKLPRKSIYLNVPADRVHTIKEHADFEHLNRVHQIIFI